MIIDKKTMKREKRDKRDFFYILLVMALVLLGMLLGGCDRSLKKENERLREELALQQQYVPMKRDTIRGSVEVVTQKV